MTKTVLIPSNFEINSLKLLKNYLTNDLSKDDKVNIILLKGINLTSSITDLLFFSKKKLIQSHASSEFNDGCNVIKNKFDHQINSIRKDIFTGYNGAAFNNYLEANNIDLAILPSKPFPKERSRKSFDIVPFIEKSKLKIKEIDVQDVHESFEKGDISEIFVGNVATSS
jgi:hypothetical protein